MTITGQERDSIPFGEVSHEQEPDGFESDLDDTPEHETMRDCDGFSEVTDTSGDEEEYDFSSNRGKNELKSNFQ